MLRWDVPARGLPGGRAVVPALAILLGVAVPAAGAPPLILNLSSSATTVGRYQRIEWRFDLSKTYLNPYYFYDPTDTPAANPSTMTWFGVNGVTVDMHLAAPSGRTLVVPAFYIEDYLRLRDTTLQLEILGKRNAGAGPCGSHRPRSEPTSTT